MDADIESSFYIVTGLSGAGKSTALRAFEDDNYFTIDGLPVSLLPEIANLLSKSVMQRYKGIAIGMDLREHDFLPSFHIALEELAKKNIKAQVLFLQAAEQELLRRYATTRRPHPLERQGISLVEAIAREKKELEGIRDFSKVIDTTGYNIYDLKQCIQKMVQVGKESSRGPRINIISFGFKYGIPEDANYVFDLRFLPNPYFVDRLKPLSGEDEEVASYVFRQSEAREFCLLISRLFAFLLPNLQKEGRSRVAIAFGCTGGRHRSVAIAEYMAKDFIQQGYAVILEHRNIGDDLVKN